MNDLLRFDRVALSRGGRLLFEDQSFSLAPGEALRVSGPNGSGKTSLIRLAAGLLRQDRGEVHRARLALADDLVALDPELPLRRALQFWGGEVDRALERVGLQELWAIPVRLLSSGQAKRAALARVVASNAPLWLLDEPLNALDADAADRLADIIDHHLHAGGAILAASHQPLSGTWRQLALGA